MDPLLLSHSHRVAVINRWWGERESMKGPQIQEILEHKFGVPNCYDWCCIAMTTAGVVVVHAVCGWLYLPGAAARCVWSCWARSLLTRGRAGSLKLGWAPGVKTGVIDCKRGEKGLLRRVRRGGVAMAMTSLMFQSPSVAPHCNMAARCCCYVCVLVVISSVSSAISRVSRWRRCRVCVRASSTSEHHHLAKMWFPEYLA